jgi:outer membrane protein
MFRMFVRRIGGFHRKPAVPQADARFLARRLFPSSHALSAASALLSCIFCTSGLAASTRQTITLDTAIDLALRFHPSEAQARANVDAAAARVVENRSQYLPQVVGTGQYQRLTYNQTGRPGIFVPSATTTTPTTAPSTASATAFASTSWTRTSDFFTFAGTASQLIYDFGQTSDRWRSAQASESAASHSEQAVQVQIISNVRRAYFQARAQRDLIDVAGEAVANQKMHVDQIQQLVGQGMRPEIDRVTAETGLANAQVQLISAQNGYDLACATFSQTIGRPTTTGYEPGTEDMPPLPEEDAPVDRLLEIALRDRPELASFAKQREAQERIVAATRGSYGPTLEAQASLAGTGVAADNLYPNWWVGALVTWPIFQGGLTHGQVAEARANLHGITAQEDTFRLQVRIDVEQAALAVRAARATLAASVLALENANKQLQLAEGRYAAGMGSVIELSDAQVTRTTAAAQVVNARFTLASSRATLWGALGRR